MIVTIHVVVIFIVRVVRTKDNGAGCTAKVPDVVFLAEGSDV